MDEEKIQIVAFSTNDTEDTPLDIINKYLSNIKYNILKKTKHAIAFTTKFPGFKIFHKIMICYVSNFNKEYNGITDVNCYLFFINYENTENKEKVDIILKYINDNCELSKKFFVFLMKKGNNTEIKPDEIKKKFEKLSLNFEIKSLNLNNQNDVYNAMKGILIYSTKHGINGNDEENDENIDKEKGMHKSCIIF